MKKLWGLLIIVFMIILLPGCGKDTEASSDGESYDSYMNSALTCISEDNFDKAMEYFQQALQIEPNDREAMNLLEQLRYLVKMTEGTSDVEVVISYLDYADEIDSIVSTSNAVKDKKNLLVNKIIKFVDDEINYIGEDIEEGIYKESKKELEKIAEAAKSHEEILKTQIMKCEKLIDECEKSLKKNDQDKASSEQNQRQRPVYDGYNYSGKKSNTSKKNNTSKKQQDSYNADDEEEYYDEEEDYYDEEYEDGYYDSEEDYYGDDDNDDYSDEESYNEDEEYYDGEEDYYDGEEDYYDGEEEYYDGEAEYYDGEEEYYYE